MAGNDDLIERLEERCAAYKGQVEAGAAEIERLTRDNEELRDTPWPEWATAVLKVIRKHSGYDGCDDALDGVDLPAELEELMSELEQQAELNLAGARAEREVEQHKASTDHYRLKANEYRARAETAERERDEARAEVERKDAALAPFADMADYIDAETEGVSDADEVDVMFHDFLFSRWPISHFRCARAALTAKGGENAD